MLHRHHHKGFTIIELVIVILLLGVLAMTALPRFMDVSDEAHEAVAKSILGDLELGMTMLQATWTAEGKQAGALVRNFGRGDLYMQNDSLGNPAGFDDSTVDANTCAEVYQGLLNDGAPKVVVGSNTTLNNDADRETIVETTASTNPTAEVIAVLDASLGTFNGDTFYGCTFYYVAQYRSGTPAAPRTIHVILTGSDGVNRVSKLSTFELKR